MELYLFVGLVCLCLILTAIFLVCRVKYGNLTGVFTKTLASFGFVVLGVMLGFTKIQPSYLSKLAICFLILGLVCGLVGDILLDLKIIYPFHDNKYLKAGMVAFGVGHIFYILSMLTLVKPEFSVLENVLPMGIILLGSLLACLLVFVISKKVLKLDFGKNATITNLYSFVLILTTTLSVYLSFLGLGFKMYILAIGFGLFLLSDLILSTQYFGGKQNDKCLIVLNHLFYYLAQIIIASFIYFI